MYCMLYYYYYMYSYNTVPTTVSTVLVRVYHTYMRAFVRRYLLVGGTRQVAVLYCTLTRLHNMLLTNVPNVPVR